MKNSSYSLPNNAAIVATSNDLSARERSIIVRAAAKFLEKLFFQLFRSPVVVAFPVQNNKHAVVVNVQIIDETHILWQAINSDTKTVTVSEYNPPDEKLENYDN